MKDFNMIAFIISFQKKQLSRKNVSGCDKMQTQQEISRILPMIKSTAPFVNIYANNLHIGDTLALVLSKNFRQHTSCH
jgi:hypothetical protein